MEIHGYMVDVEWDGEELVATGTTKAARMALRGQQHGDGPVRIARDAMASVTIKDASALVNGRITVRTAAGQEYKLHFRRKQAPEFRELAAALGAQPV